MMLLKKNKSTLTADYQSEIIEEMKKIVDKYNNDDKIKERIKKDTSVFYKFTCKVFEKDKYSISFYIAKQDSDYILSVVGNIVDEMANELKKKLNDNTLSIHTGDGDEGCIFVEKKK